MTMGVGTLLRAGPVARLCLIAALLPAAGFGAAAVRSLAVAAPVLPYAMTANVEGRIIGLDLSDSGRPRVLFDQVVIHGLAPERTPERVRISLEPDTPEELLRPGLRLLGYARLSPPAAPSEPGGFDFRRMAWFMRLGAVGYARTPMLETAGRDRAGPAQAMLSLRLGLSRAIQRAVPGREGGFAAAILTGDRSGVDPVGLGALRASNLAHLLAISGLHMGLVSGFVFAMVRYGLAAVPGMALRYPTKKIAAIVALVAGAAYLALSGANVATQRAFIMTAVVLVAVLLDRPAFTLRAVALAAMIVLAARPESLTTAGFQMSFAATTALIATFEWLRGRTWWRETHGEAWRYFRPVLAVAVTSLVAGAATAPFSAFHFNTLSQYGLLANVLAVPSMGLVVMPAAVVAALLAPLGLAAPALWVMQLGIRYILEVAEFVAGLDGAVRAVPAGPIVSLALITLGGLFAMLWRGRGRALGLLPAAAGLVVWAAADRPDILITEDGRLFGIRTETGRVLNTARGNSFAAGIWLGNDGDTADQEAAFARAAVAGMERRRGVARMQVAGLGGFLYRGSPEPDAQTGSVCDEVAILLAPRWRAGPDGRCLFIGADLLRREGALAIRIADGQPIVEGARSSRNRRPWTRRAARDR
jgi:competence protein ComEC